MNLPGCAALVMLFAFAHSLSYAQGVLLESEKQFVEALISDGGGLERFVDKNEIQYAHRLGIQYGGVNNKWLIGFDFDQNTQRKIRTNELRYSTTVEVFEDGFRRITISIHEVNLSKSFIFKNGLIVSPVHYYTRKWVHKSSRYFDFLISDTTLFHPDAMHQLDDFVVKTSALLKFNVEEDRALQKGKIVYVMCKDENEVELLTGYKSRGMYLLAYDYVVTAYSCHFHELAHLLMNYKLKNLSLYTHPLLQEGFAVAFGGRGGIAPQTLLQSAVFLVKSGFVDDTVIRSASAFKSNDASITYPVSGLYVRFLVSSLGMDSFLRLYLKYGTDEENAITITLNETDLQLGVQWRQYIDSLSVLQPIRLGNPWATPVSRGSEETPEIKEGGGYYQIRASGAFALKSENPIPRFRSKRFTELFPGREYQGEQYLFMIDSSEVTVYDLYADNSIAGFSSGFSLKGEKVQMMRGKYEFWIEKDIFSHSLTGLQLVNLDGSR